MALGEGVGYHEVVVPALKLVDGYLAAVRMWREASVGASSRR